MTTTWKRFDRAGYTDGEIAEIIANVALTTFTNYFNTVADTEIDFPVAPSRSGGVKLSKGTAKSVHARTDVSSIAE